MKTLGRREDVDEIIRRVRGLRAESARRWGRMSPPEMVRHLIAAFQLGLGEKSAVWPSRLLGRTVVKWLVLYAPFRWPKNVPGPNTTRSAEEQAVPLSAAIEELERIIPRFILSKKRNAMLAHPFFGPLTDAQWNRWAYLHTDHHLRQFGL